MAKASLLYSGEKDSGGASEFVARVLGGVTMAHMHHLMTDSYAKHMALNQLYEDLQDHGDDLAEAAMGCMQKKLAFTGCSIAIGQDAVADVQALYDYVEQNRQMMGPESHIQNIVDEICSDISSALYKLRMLA